ncbi:CDP-alcohol phosphatidyltransferase family protein [Actinocorallia sp. API 0066]|uniref:CDP-alcohol phosphatidyltransferase family protein n=1 Tax=Actinocorallia sp. API 0066 TaxID=2896846 RepID=UPI001E5D8C12|nr:CDP-alcohol phosphatidyltransferase family protein [Actinocorallia sp. API 0066]MCD0451993.1 CDP-alcohol phosphatidyltransferase family protein [Actinocorallia sp. API 0066]
MSTAETECATTERLSPADFLTLGNALCGIAALRSIMVQGDFSGTNSRLFAGAVLLMLIGAVCDLFDGRMARRWRSTPYGPHLDNLADVITFGLVPAAMTLAWVGFDDDWAMPAMVAAAAFFLAIVVRLARYVTAAPEPGIFRGMPAPLCAFTVVCVIVLEPPVPMALAAIGCVALLAVSRLPFPKPTSRTLVAVMVVWAACGAASVVAWAAGLPGGETGMRFTAASELFAACMIPVIMLKLRHTTRDRFAPRTTRRRTLPRPRRRVVRGAGTSRRVRLRR